MVALQGRNVNDNNGETDFGFGHKLIEPLLKRLHFINRGTYRLEKRQKRFSNIPCCRGQFLLKIYCKDVVSLIALRCTSFSKLTTLLG